MIAMKRSMTFAAAFAAFALTFAACQPEDKPGNEGENNGQENVDPKPDEKPDDSGNTGTTTPEDNLAPEVKDGDRILVTNPDVEKFLNDVSYPDHDYTYSELRTWAEENGVKVCPNTRDADKPQTYTIRWKADESAGAVSVKLWYDEWSRVFDVKAGESHLNITNLVPNVHYHFEAKAGDKLLTSGEFDTYGSVRQLFFKVQTRNIRDLGGWKTTDGKTVKYRMIYRGGRFLIKNFSSQGKADMVAEGIKAQLDLRGVDDVLSPDECTLIGLVEDYEFCAPVIEEGYIWLLRDEPEKTRQLMQFIMDCVDKNKPVIFHCSLGRDRTGTVAMMVLGLLGVPEGDISQEYELTQFSAHGYATSDGEKTKMTRTVDYKLAANYIWDTFVDEAAGETFADGVEKYLLSIGITQEDIDKFRENMLK